MFTAEASAPTIVERRASPRRETNESALIAFRGSPPMIRCIVWNVSEGGACLGLERTSEIPEAFQLVFNSGEPSRTCYMMWRAEKRIGVAFG